jgi:epoxyqueuosine reductase
VKIQTYIYDTTANRSSVNGSAAIRRAEDSWGREAAREGILLLEDTMRPAQADEAKAQIVEWGRAVGLSAVGVAPPEVPAHGEFLLEWLRRGYHAGMAYLARSPAARCDPEQILEGCRSILCARLDYGVGSDPAGKDPTLGRISRYAWGEDYHSVLRKKLEGLAEKIRARWPQVRTRVAVDTSPVLEKAFAAAAGLGWMGKHTNLIAPDRGSWFFLGEVFMTLPLIPDEPMEDRCGGCTRCVEACPTGALVAPYVLDARRCLAYWNIEHRGEIPAEIGATMDNWIFGCDLCQLACPWNRSCGGPLAPLRAPYQANIGRSLEEWALLGRDEFRERFGNSAVKRAGHEGLLRNVEIALRNARGRADPAA